MTTMFIINQNDLAKKAREECTGAGDAAKDIVQDIFADIAGSLKEGKTVSINGFGKFEVRQRSARSGINPATKEKITIEAIKAPVFRPGKAFKDKLNKD